MPDRTLHDVVAALALILDAEGELRLVASLVKLYGEHLQFYAPEVHYGWRRLGDWCRANVGELACARKLCDVMEDRLDVAEVIGSHGAESRAQIGALMTRSANFRKCQGATRCRARRRDLDIFHPTVP